MRGPITKLLLRRTLLIWLTVQLVGLAIVLTDTPAPWKAFGLGLMFPGAGFLYAGHFIHFAVSFVSFLVVAATVIIGNLLMPLLMWGGYAVWAATHTHHPTWEPALWLVPSAVVLLSITATVAARRSAARTRARAEKRNQHLARVETSYVRSAPAALAPELSQADFGHVRYVLDRALQPIDQFNGFDIIDQFQMAGLRYQLTYSQLALAYYQYSHAPAFRGYLLEGQQNTLKRMQDKRVWSYWRYENLWGNLRYDPDPIGFDNVMYSGYFGTMLGTYATVTGDRSYNDAGSISLRWNDKKSYTYGFRSLAEILYQQHRDSPENFIACEPGWCYPICNSFSMNALLYSDRLNGTDYAERILPLFENALVHEFMTPDGRFLNARHRITGLAFPVPTSIVDDGFCAVSYHPILPELAERSWEIIRDTCLSFAGDGTPSFDVGSIKFDVGNYRFSALCPLVSALMAAKEMGDQEASDALEYIIREQFPPTVKEGELNYPDGSVSTNLMLAMARLMRPGVFHDLARVGMPEGWLEGPVLLEAAFPDVFVARAVADGGALDLVLLPGEGSGNQKLKLGSLMPNKKYRVTGNHAAELAAGADGTAEFVLPISGRTTIRIQPAA